MHTCVCVYVCVRVHVWMGWSYIYKSIVHAGAEGGAEYCYNFRVSVRVQSTRLEAGWSGWMSVGGEDKTHIRVTVICSSSGLWTILQ